MNTIDTLTQNETFNNLLTDLRLTDYKVSENVSALAAVNARYIKDLKINAGNVLNNCQHLSRKEAYLLAFCVAVNEKFDPLKKSFAEIAKEEGASEEEIAEMIALTSLMNTNNVFYRFRHFMNKDSYTNMPAGIKMSIMMNPVTGKAFFELASIAVSALNGCEQCVVSHEKSVVQHGSTEQKVFEAVKLTAVIKGLIAVLS